MTATPSPSLLRFVTAGSVDDGKSTLIGRLLYDAKGLMRDQVRALGQGRPASALDEGELDLALVTDGLEAEREQGITIDVAYRYFATPNRSFIIADAPGHEQYTRNLVTAASTADVAVVLIDAARTQGKPLKIQTRRHMTLAHMLGLTLVVAVNKMDAVGWSRSVFDDLASKARHLARALGTEPHAIVPISAKAGDNVVERRAAEAWYDGPTLMEVLETVPALDLAARGPLRMPVQRVAVQDGRRLYQGRIESGLVRVGDPVTVAPSRRASTIAAIQTFDGPLDIAVAGQSVSLVLADEVDVARGDLLAAPGVPLAHAVVADLCWLDETAWRPGAKYLLKQGSATSQARIDVIVHVRDVAGLSEARPAEGLALNDIAQVRLKAGMPLLADRFEDVPAVGGFILIDPLTNQTAAAGMIQAAA